MYGIIKWRLFPIAIWLSIFVSGASLASNGRISLEAKVDKSKITIGDLIHYSIIVTRNANVTIEMPELGANLGAFEIRDYNDPEPEKRKGEIIQRREYIISTYDIGDYEIPPVLVRYRVAGDSTWKELASETIKITVASVKPSETSDIRDIKPPMEIARDWKRIIRFAVAGLLILVIAILVFYFIKRRKEGKSLIPRREKPKLPPHEIALNELNQLLEEQLLEQGAIKEFYIRISEIIRRYVEGRFFIVAIEMTSSQLIDAMKTAEIEPAHVQMLHDFLFQCDMVKFAKYVPTAEENRSAIDQAFQFIHATKILLESEAEASVGIDIAAESSPQTIEATDAAALQPAKEVE